MQFTVECVNISETMLHNVWVMDVWMKVWMKEPHQTWVSTLFDALASVWDPSWGVSRVDDVALVTSWAEQRLISILCGAAGLSYT